MVTAKHRIITKNNDGTGECSVCGIVDLVWSPRETYPRCSVRVSEHNRRQRPHGGRSTFKDGFARPTLVEQDKMLEAQGGLCLICQEPLIDYAVDHCHETGRVRGLLCNPCNFGLGFFRDNIGRLARAIGYLVDVS